MAGLRQPGRGREGITVTASVTLTNHDVGKTYFSNAGAACTFTLPAPGTCNAGDEILFVNLVDQNMLIALNELIITKNNAAADSVSFETSSEKIGAAALAVCTGSKWAVLPLAEELMTITVATD